MELGMWSGPALAYVLGLTTVIFGKHIEKAIG